MSTLLARSAEAAFWMARYMERAENQARLLDVNETFARDRRGAQNWGSIVQLNTDDERFSAKHAEATAETITRFYLLDLENPTSIRSCIRMARENARALRPVISTEAWAQLNTVYNALVALRPEDVSSKTLSARCAEVKEAVQTHTGIVEGTYYRDEGWHFYQLGRALERADQTTRLLDVKYHILLPKVADVGSPLDISQWNAVLRSAAGYHGYRRLHPRGIDPTLVAEFLLFNRVFPRSVALCVDTAGHLLHELRSRFRLRRGDDILERLDELQSQLDGQDAAEILTRGLHEFLDLLQAELNAVSLAIGEAFFGYAPADA